MTTEGANQCLGGGDGQYPNDPGHDDLMMMGSGRRLLAGHRYYCCANFSITCVSCGVLAALALLVSAEALCLNVVCEIKSGYAW